MKRVGIKGEYKEGRWALVDSNGLPLTEYKYWFVEPIGEGYFRAQVTGGSQYNLLRTDGTEVFRESFSSIGQAHHGLLIVGITKRKTKTTPTQYLSGIAHVNGDFLLPIMDSHARWLYELLDVNGNRVEWENIPENKTEDDYEKRYYAIQIEIEGYLYFVKLDGGIYDPAESHLPPKTKIDTTDFFEKVANWVLPGLQFFYRDTNAPIIAEDVYHVNAIIRAGFFIDTTTKLLKPIHRTRFLIASAHTARLFEIEDLVMQNPNVGLWNLSVLHFNSYFKVMDVYKVDGVTQVFLLHIPETAARLLGDNEMAFNFFNHVAGQEGSTLIEIARNSLEEKMRQEVHSRSLNKEWEKRTFHPIGLDNNYQLFSLFPAEEPTDDKTAGMSSFIHKLAEDADIEISIKEEDNFPFVGIEKSICENCFFSAAIKGHGECCGCLGKEEFRKHYIKGRCDYRKETETELSWYERKEQEKILKANREANPLKEATTLVTEFITEKLGGDIDHLLTYDFTQLKNDEKYGYCRGYAFSPTHTEIVRALLTLIFDGVWVNYAFAPEQNKNVFGGCLLQTHQRLLGAAIAGEYFKGLSKYNPSKALEERANDYYSILYFNLGNMVLMPKAFELSKESTLIKGYMDKFLSMIHTYLINPRKTPYSFLDTMNSCKKELAEYIGIEGFHLLTERLLLQDYLDSDGNPKEIFKLITMNDKFLSRDNYLEAVEKYLSFCEEHIPRRAEKMLSVLKERLS